MNDLMDYKLVRLIVVIFVLICVLLFCLPIVLFAALVALIRWDYYWFDKLAADAFGIITEGILEKKKK